jgi:hypothetical protein
MVAVMAERITHKQFHDAAGVDDWRVLWSVAFAVLRGWAVRLLPVDPRVKASVVQRTLGRVP